MDEQSIDLTAAPRAPYGGGAGTTRLAGPTARTVPVPRWAATQTAPSPVVPAPAHGAVPPSADQPPRRWRKRKYLAVAAASGLAALVLGIGIGAVGGSAGTAAAEERADTAVQRAERSEADAADAQAQLSAAQQSARDAVSAQEEAEAALDGARTAAADASAQVAELQRQLASAQASAQASAKSTAKAGSPASGTGSATGSTSRSSHAPATSSVSYANCSAARAAGAAPVHAGDPGYSRKLDRDGDGVGCE